MDADDDLIESGSVNNQILRGFSEVSVQSRHIELRRITSHMRSHLFHAQVDTPCSSIHSMSNHVITRLDHWRDAFPLLHEPCSVYESKHWRDLNYSRERLRCFRFLFLLERTRKKEAFGSGSCLKLALEAASQVASLYHQIKGTNKLVMNWTCVHDVLSAGFTVLYCGLIYGESDGAWSDSLQAWTELRSLILDSIASISETLSHIAEHWAVVGKHLLVFRTLAGRVSDAIQTRHSLMEYASDWQQLGDLSGENWELPMGFPEHVNGLDHIDWSQVDWTSIFETSGMSPEA